MYLCCSHNSLLSVSQSGLFMSRAAPHYALWQDLVAEDADPDLVGTVRSQLTSYTCQRSLALFRFSALPVICAVTLNVFDRSLLGLVSCLFVVASLSADQKELQSWLVRVPWVLSCCVRFRCSKFLTSAQRNSFALFDWSVACHTMVCCSSAS